MNKRNTHYTRTPIIVALLLLASGCTEKPQLKDVRGFEDCSKAGYTIESFPRQCKTPDNRTFTSETDVFDTLRNTNCNDDADCRFISTKNGFGCCGKGCDPQDYSSGEWISVNKDWHQGLKTQYCPKNTECEPQPNCTAQTPKDDYKPACMNGKCTKIQTT